MEFIIEVICLKKWRMEAYIWNLDEYADVGKAYLECAQTIHWIH